MSYYVDGGDAAGVWVSGGGWTRGGRCAGVRGRGVGDRPRPFSPALPECAYAARVCAGTRTGAHPIAYSTHIQRWQRGERGSGTSASPDRALSPRLGPPYPWHPSSRPDPNVHPSQPPDHVPPCVPVDPVAASAAVGRATYQLARRSPAVSGLPTSRSLAATARTPQCPGAEQRPLVPRDLPAGGHARGGGWRPASPVPAPALPECVYAARVCDGTFTCPHAIAYSRASPDRALVLAMPAPCPVRGPRCSGSGVRFEGRPRNRGPLTTRPQRPQRCRSKAPAGAPPLYVDAVCDGCAPARPAPSGVAPTAPVPRAPGPPSGARRPPLPAPPARSWPAPCPPLPAANKRGGDARPPHD